MSLHKKMVSGAAWVFLERIGNQGVSFVVFMIVTRLIGPEEYGLAGICFVFFCAGNIVICNLADGIIILQIRDNCRLSTLFWCIFGIGCLLTLACFAGASRVAQYMDMPRLTLVLRCFSPVFICIAASDIPTKLLISELRFKIIAIRTISASVVGGVVGVVMAFMGFGALAIVTQQICFFMVMNIVVWYSVHWRPQFFFDPTILKRSLFPGFKTLASECINFAEEQLPRMFAAAILGPLAIGYYAFVGRIRYAVYEVLCHPLLEVLYPSVAQIGDNREEQANILGNVIKISGLIIFPVLALGAYEAPVYVPLLFGEKWKSAIPVLQIFIAASGVLPLLATIRESLRAHNKLSAYMKLQLPLALMTLFLAVILLRYGLLITAAGLSCWSLASLPFYVYLFKRCTGISLWRPMALLIKPLVSVALMVETLFLYTNSTIYPSSPWLCLLSSSALGVCIYVMATFALQYNEIMKIAAYARQLAWQR
jgi:O-antigen/teichoic acid export membrane protein